MQSKNGASKPYFYDFTSTHLFFQVYDKLVTLLCLQSGFGLSGKIVLVYLEVEYGIKVSKNRSKMNGIDPKLV